MEVGRVLAGRYKIVRPLAEGAMSTVWVAFDEPNGENVAVKTISLDAAGWRAEVRDRFLKEARLLARVKHEHLVGVRDMGETDDGFLYLVLDLLEGETLADRLARETRISWREAVVLMKGIADGVAALHRANIVHRDLKPANIVLHKTSEGVVPMIIDLGIGKASAATGDPELCATLTATGQVLGTPQYMSYEQALGQTDIDVRSDVWALGVMLHEMLTGVRPFDAPNTNAVLAAIRRHNTRSDPLLLPNVPAHVNRIVDICLRTNRLERFSDAGDLSTKLDGALTIPMHVNEPLLERQARQPRRKFVLAAFSAAALATIAALVLLKGSLLPSTPPQEVPSERAPLPNSSVSASEGPHNAAPAQSNLETTDTAAPTAPTQPVSAPRKPGSPGRPRTPISSVNEAGF